MANPQEVEVDRNWDAFQMLLPDIIHAHRGKHALMRDGKIIDFFDGAWEAYQAGADRLIPQTTRSRK